MIFFNKIPKKLAEGRTAAGEEEIAYRDLIYADDVTSLIATKNREDLIVAARQNSQTLRETMRHLGLRLHDAKTNSMLIDPTCLPGGIFQRAPQLRSLSTTARVRDNLLREEYMAYMLEQDGAREEEEGGTKLAAGSRDTAQQNLPFPYPIKRAAKVLGVEIDWFLTLDDQFVSILKKAQIRQGILSRVT